MTRASEKSVIVTVGDDALANIHEVAKKLSEGGMLIEQVIPVMGMISGSVELQKLAKLRKIKGILGIDEEVRAQLPGPGEPQ